MIAASCQLGSVKDTMLPAGIRRVKACARTVARSSS
jgi:hypothetical protein